MDRIQSDMNEWLTPQFGDDLKLHYDIDSIPAMAEQRRRVFESYKWCTKWYLNS